MTPEHRALLAELHPATDLLVAHLLDTVRDQRNHDHPGPRERSDLYCLNLTSFMGERMGAVLRRLADAEAEIARLRARHDALAEEATGYLDALAELEPGESEGPDIATSTTEQPTAPHPGPAPYLPGQRQGGESL